MENKYENKEIIMTSKEPGLLKHASESLLANLPILICGMAVALAVIREMFM